MPNKAMTVQQAGHLGGEKTAQTHGRDFYEKIGRKGGRARGKMNGRGKMNMRSRGRNSTWDE